MHAFTQLKIHTHVHIRFCDPNPKLTFMPRGIEQETFPHHLFGLKLVFHSSDFVTSVSCIPDA